MKASPAEARIFEEVRAIMEAHPQDGPQPLYPDVWDRGCKMLAFGVIAPARRTAPMRRLIWSAAERGVAVTMRGQRAALSPNIPTWTPTAEQRAWLERVADNPSDPGHRRAGLLLVAARGQIPAHMSADADRTMTYAMLSAMRAGGALREVTTTISKDILRDMGQRGRETPPDPTAAEIAAAAAGARTDAARRRAEVLRLVFVVGVPPREAAARTGYSDRSVWAIMGCARHSGADVAVRTGSGPARYVATGGGRQRARLDALRSAYLELVAEGEGVLPTVSEVVRRAGAAQGGAARDSLAALRLPVRTGKRGPKPKMG